MKAKSFDGVEHAQRLANGKVGVLRDSRKPHGVIKDWDEKLADLTYRVLLLEQVLPHVTIEPYLVLVDKGKTAALDNVPSLFELVRRDGPDGRTRLHTARVHGFIGVAAGPPPYGDPRTGA